MEIICEYGHNDCSNLGKKCDLCILKDMYYKPIVIKQVGLKKNIKVKETSRQGSIQEVKVYNQTRDSVQGTPNSGAGSIKGDLEIDTMAMIECKTTTKKNEGRQPGKESFSIQRAWLEKLRTEAKGKKEFHYLVFSFKEHDDDQYVVSDLDVYNSMIATMKHDRKVAKEAQNQIDLHKKFAMLQQAKNHENLARIEFLEALLKEKGINIDECIRGLEDKKE